MKKGSHFNQQARRSGGFRPTKFYLPNLSIEDLEILRQEAEIRREFGEEGVRQFWESIPSTTETDG